MNRSVVILALGAFGAAACAVATTGSPDTATEASLMQADRDFAIATHARGIDGWMSSYARDAIRIRYRANMVKGYAAVREFDAPGLADTTSTLNWEPTDAHVFSDKRIGSTTGRYWVTSRKTGEAGKQLGSGHYVTMWRRDGGRWLVIMDTGYPDPSA
jgi:ketosteroid isomerase-like protein